MAAHTEQCPPRPDGRRHPLPAAGPLAQGATTLDVLSGGRAWFGIGAAWNEEESRPWASRCRRCASGSSGWRRRSRWRTACGAGGEGSGERFEGRQVTATRLPSKRSPLPDPRSTCRTPSGASPPATRSARPRLRLQGADRPRDPPGGGRDLSPHGPFPPGPGLAARRHRGARLSGGGSPLARCDDAEARARVLALVLLVQPVRAGDDRVLHGSSPRAPLLPRGPRLGSLSVDPLRAGRPLAADTTLDAGRLVPLRPRVPVRPRDEARGLRHAALPGGGDPGRRIPGRSRRPAPSGRARRLARRRGGLHGRAGPLVADDARALEEARRAALVLRARRCDRAPALGDALGGLFEGDGRALLVAGAACGAAFLAVQDIEARASGTTRCPPSERACGGSARRGARPTASASRARAWSTTRARSGSTC